MNKTDDTPDIKEGMGLFERYLSVWVALAIVAGVWYLTN